MEVDNPASLSDIVLDENSVEAAVRPDLLEDVTILEGAGQYTPPDVWADRLYRRDEELVSEPVEITAVPYYAWDNREPSEMLVWLRSD